MIILKKVFSGLYVALLTASCSVQQFAVNINTQPFERGGKVWGEKTEKCGINGWKFEFRKDRDLHLLGVNVKKAM